MPELPEVETVARGLRGRLVGRRVLGLQGHFPGVLRVGAGIDVARAGWTVESIARRGKLLLVQLSGDLCLSVHLRMTGHLSVERPEVARRPHTHVTARLDDGSELRFVDPRRFGHVQLSSREELALTPFLAGLGPEPFDLDADGLAGRLAARQGPLKSVLLDQRVVAGIGNIYADEILFAAGLHPRQPANGLLAPEIARLCTAMHRILEEAIEGGGSTIRDYRMLDGRSGEYQERHAVFGREGAPCPRCGAALRKTKLAGRGTHFCASCQPKRRRRPRPRKRMDGAPSREPGGST